MQVTKVYSYSTDIVNNIGVYKYDWVGRRPKSYLVLIRLHPTDKHPRSPTAVVHNARSTVRLLVTLNESEVSLRVSLEHSSRAATTSAPVLPPCTSALNVNTH